MRPFAHIASHNGDRSFTVIFRQSIWPPSFCEQGSIAFLDDALSIHGSLVTKTFVPMVHFWTFAILAVGGNIIAGDTGLIIGILLSIVLGFFVFTYIPRRLRNVSRIIPYHTISEVSLKDGGLRFRCLNQVPSVIAFRVAAIDGERFSKEVMQHFPMSFVIH